MVRAKRKKIATGGDHLHVEEGGNKRAPRGRNPKRVLFEHVSSPKKRWEGETSYQPEKIESICSHPPLQNGGHTNSQRAGSTKRLDDQNRPKGRLLYNTSRRASP